ncbi:hypothetical protein RhiirB3_401336 [Rhizophagus irregularis]|nr:hypothetical protein RhiirB3_401336 [Rhizophagus irregularis]
MSLSIAQILNIRRYYFTTKVIKIITSKIPQKYKKFEIILQKRIMHNQQEALDDDEIEAQDLFLVIIPNNTWINQYGMAAYNAVMDIFATNGMGQNQRRDRNSRHIFHFREIADLYSLRDRIKNNNLAPNAFCVSPDILNYYQLTFNLIAPNPPNLQQIPIGTAWIITKMGVTSSDYTEDRQFFYF